MKIHCPYCALDPKAQLKPGSDRIIAKGYFYRKSDRRRIHRYRCKLCQRGFSAASSDPFYRSQTRQLNQAIYVALCSTNSQRRTARTLKITRGTIARKLVIMSKLCEARMDFENRKRPGVMHCQFDDQETHEHTKMKPLSITIAVSSERCVLALAVSRMPARGPLAEASRMKYGAIKDERSQGRAELFSKLQPLLSPTVVIRSDQNPHYTNDVKRAFPFANHQTTKGRAPRSSGQGELKKGILDPLFALNHTCAMFRANVNRLIRKTWCTTKKAECLYMHLHLYADYHNEWIRRACPPHLPNLRKGSGGGYLPAA